MNKAYGKFFCKPVHTNKLHFFNKNVTGIMHKKLAAKVMEAAKTQDVVYCVDGSVADDNSCAAKGGRERGSIEISCLCADQSRN